MHLEMLSTSLKAETIMTGKRIHNHHV